MFGKMQRKALLPLVASLFLAVAPASWAACPVTTSTVGSGATTIKVAVAANFTSMLTTWLNTNFFVTGTNATDFNIELCSTATGTIKAAIDANTYSPDVFFAADNTTENMGKDRMAYAKGYPIIMGYITGTSGKSYTLPNGLSDLVSGLSGTYYNLDAGADDLASYSIGSALTGSSNQVAIANPSLAPYGLMSESILNAMQPIANSSNPVYYLPSSVPSWIVPLTTYTAVSDVKTAIGTSVPAGFYAFSQICQSIPTGARWVKFTNSEFWTNQWVARMTNSTGGTALYNLIYSQMTDNTVHTSTTWYGFITQNPGSGQCYADF
jgi:ABC-type molybdate transport system substrate-binding protein